MTLNYSHDLCAVIEKEAKGENKKIKVLNPAVTVSGCASHLYNSVSLFHPLSGADYTHLKSCCKQSVTSSSNEL